MTLEGTFSAYPAIVTSGEDSPLTRREPRHVEEFSSAAKAAADSPATAANRESAVVSFAPCGFGYKQEGTAPRASIQECA